MELVHRRIVIWGTGNNAKLLNEMYPNELDGEDILGYVDNDKKKWGKLFCGKVVFRPDDIINIGISSIYVSVSQCDDIISQIREIFGENPIEILHKDYFKKIRLITRYKDSDDKEIKEIINYLQNNDLDVFNYIWVKEYKNRKIDIGYEGDMYYVLHNGKKLFFSKKYDDEIKVREYYISLLIEQDYRSPHRYLTDSHNVSFGDIVVDAGAAEGIFSLDIVDKAKKIYMFEPEHDWVQALERTFSQYMEKVEIIEKCVSNYVDLGTITIDKAVSEDTIGFIKIDIEGEEYYAIDGAKSVLERSNNVKCSICTYHQEFAYYAIKDKLERIGFKTEHSAGYMWYIEHFNEMRPMTLRRGIIRGEKNK